VTHNQKHYYGGYFENEEHAAMKVNLLCDKLEIERKNPTINLQPDETQQQFNKNKTSKYFGVSWRKENKKWHVYVTHNKKKYYGGYFENEEHAAMKVNLLCDKLEIERKNPTINLEPNEIQQQVQNRTSKYRGVSWHKNKKNWQVSLKHKKNRYYGGCFENEELAAMNVNFLCDKLEIERKNPTINLQPDEIQQKKSEMQVLNMKRMMILCSLEQMKKFPCLIWKKNKMQVLKMKRMMISCSLEQIKKFQCLIWNVIQRMKTLAMRLTKILLQSFKIFVKKSNVQIYSHIVQKNILLMVHLFVLLVMKNKKNKLRMMRHKQNHKI